MPIIKKTDIIQAGDPLKEMKQSLIATQKLVDKLTGSNKQLATALQLVKKTNDGNEAKKLIDELAKLNKGTAKLTAAKKAEIAAKKQLITAEAKLVQSYEAEAQQLAQVKIEQKERNKLLGQNAQKTGVATDSLKRMRITLSQATDKYDKLSKAERENIKVGGKLQRQIKSLSNSLKKQENQTGRNQRSVGKYADALKNVGAQMLGGLGLLALFSALGNVMRNAFKIFTEFSKAGSKLAAILGTTKKGIKSLTDQAKILGATTAYTASEILGLQTELAKLGFSMQEIENSTAGILDLAAATGSELAPAAELAGASLRIFNLDASQMSRVTDVLALSTTKSSLTMEKLATALPIVGKTAQLAGLNIEQTASLLGTLTNRGIDASSAGTSLRRIFIELSKKGITYNDAMEKINNSTNKTKTAVELFGARAATAAAVLAETTESTRDLELALNDANGAAKDMAETMLNNLAGDMTKATSAWQGLVQSIADGEGPISKVFRNVTQWATRLLGELTQLNNGSSLALIGMKNTAKFEEKLSKFREKSAKSLEGINKNTEKKIKLDGKAAILTGELSVIERKLLREREGNLDLSKKERTELEFNRDLLKGKIKIIGELTPGIIKQIDAEIDLTKETTKQTKSINANNDAKREQLRLDRESKIEANKIETGTKAQTVKADDCPIKKKKECLTKEEEAQKEHENAMNEILSDSQTRQNATAKKAGDDIIKADAQRKEYLKTAAVAAAQETANLVSAIAGGKIDEELNKEKDKAEAQKDILKSRLDAGLISESEYNAKLEKINSDMRRKEAIANKKKAIFDIGINTLVAIIKAFANLGPIKGIPAAVGIAIEGGIKAAAVAATPIPKFKDGTEFVEGAGTGTSDSIDAKLSRGERVVDAKTNSLLNGIPNKDLPKLVNYNDNVMIEMLLKQNNSDTKEMIGLLKNNESSYENNGFVYRKLATGKIIKDRKIIN